jgi:UDP-glucose:glycoprotein glucosyltransferase
MHRALKAAADAGEGARRLVYAHRPVLGGGCREAPKCLRVGTEEQLVLPGYGVEAVLKNMEYSAMDDKKPSAAEGGGGSSDGSSDGSGGGSAAEPLGDAKGFKLDTLAARRPALRQELLTLRDALLAGDDGDAAIKVGVCARMCCRAFAEGEGLRPRCF